jgi:hypothetical protein
MQGHADWWEANTPNQFPAPYTENAWYRNWYYDQTEVAYRLGIYTNNPGLWHGDVMNDPYNWLKGYSESTTPDGKITGYEIAAAVRGVYWWWVVNGHPAAAETVMTNITTQGDFARDSSDWTGYTHYGNSREAAYVIIGYLWQQKMFGNAKRPKYDEVIGYVKAHVTEWWVTYLNNWVLYGAMQPFMVGLTMRTLIEHYEKYADATVPGLIKTCLDGLWNNAWLSGPQSLYFHSDAPTTPAPDLALLIAPAFAWYYRQIVLYGAPGTAATYRDRGNLVWDDGVTGATLTLANDAKIFNQNYTWSYDYVTWYNQADGDLTPPAAPTGVTVQ